MITAKQVFGSYILSPVTLEDISPCPLPENILIGRKNIFENCAIGRQWTALQLLQIQTYNHDTSIFRFSLPAGCSRLNLPAGSFLLVKMPETNQNGDEIIRPYTSISDDDILGAPKGETGSFEILCKRYEEWGKKENLQNNFLFTKTDHSYRPAGIVSNHIHKMCVGSQLCFKFTPQCVGRLSLLLAASSEAELAVNTITIIAVGVGIAPFIGMLRALFKERDRQLKEATETQPNNKVHTLEQCLPRIQVKLMYGTRTVEDILMRGELEDWQARYEDMFSVLFCVGSRWANVHMGVKTKDYQPPPIPEGFGSIANSAELGWVNEDKIRRHAFPPAENTRVVVCGLPGVYDKICGPRSETHLGQCSVLRSLGYEDHMVIKL